MFKMSKIFQTNKMHLTALAAVAAFVCSASNGASAQNSSVTMKKGQLQQAGWFKSAPQIQIVDDGPVVHDLRTAPAQDQSYQLPIGPAGANGRIPEGGIPLGNGGGPMQMRVAPNNLPQAGFSSNVPARGMGPARALPGTEMGQLGKQYAADQRRAAQSSVSARPIGRRSGQSAVAAPNRIASPAAAYSGGYQSSGGGYVAPSSSSSTSLRGVLLGKGK